MNVILLSGDSGNRLWPLSNNIRAKQFIKIFQNENNEYVSMIKKTIDDIRKVDKNVNITISTSKKQVSIINSQIDGNFDICIEPCKRGTFPIILLTAIYLADVKKIDLDESIIICPVDTYADSNYYELLKKIDENSKNSNANITLIGIKPTYVSEKYGYIMSNGDNNVGKVLLFKEKPNREQAEVLIKNDSLWNSGIYACKLKYLVELAHNSIEFDDYYDLFNKYSLFNNRSFENIVLEKEKNLDVIKYDGNWKDLGTWNTLTESMSDNVVGNATLDEFCHNTHIINELDIPILAMGLKDIVVAASSDGILISDKNRSSYISSYTTNFEEKIMYAEKSWGSFKVIDIQEESMTLIVTLKKGNRMKYHSHDFRDEVWTVISGTGKTIVDGMEQIVKPGDVITIQAGCKHTIIATTDLKVIEVQIGKEINANDKHKYKLEDE